jgi:hypothetical protein
MMLIFNGSRFKKTFLEKNKQMYNAILKTMFFASSMYHGINDIGIIFRDIAGGRQDYFLWSVGMYGISTALMTYWLQRKKNHKLITRLVFYPWGLLHLAFQDGWRRLMIMVVMSTIVNDVHTLVYLYLMIIHYTGMRMEAPIMLPRGLLCAWEAVTIISTILVEPWERSHDFFETALIAVFPAHFILEVIRARSYRI